MLGDVRPPERLGRNPRRQLLDPLGLVAVAAKLLVEEHRVQPVEARLERVRAVRLPEELRVPQPRRDDALGVLRDEALVGGLRVDDGEERFLERAGLGHDREPVLVMHEGRREHFFGKDQEPGVEEAGDDRRILDEVRDLFDERGMILQVDAPAEPVRVHLEIARDPVAPVGVAEDHEVLGQLRLVLVEAADLDRTSCAAARRQKPVTVGQRARLHVLDRRSGRSCRSPDRERDDAATVEKEQPPDGTAEEQLPPPVVERRVPVHLLGERQIAKHAGEDVGQRIDGAAPALVLLKGQVLALRRLRARQLLERHALLAGKAQSGRTGLAVLGEGGRDGRAGDRFVEVLLPLRDAGDAGGQTPGRAEALDRSARRDAKFREARVEPLAKLPREPGHPRCGQFFDADFYEEFSIHQLSLSRCIPDHGFITMGTMLTTITMQTRHHMPSCSSCHRAHRDPGYAGVVVSVSVGSSLPSPTHAFAIATASCRTRRM